MRPSLDYRSVIVTTLSAVVLAACSSSGGSGAQPDAASLIMDGGVTTDAAAPADAALDGTLRDAAPVDAQPRDGAVSDASADAGRSCDDIATDYLGLRNLARTCNMTASDACGAEVADRIGCGCTAFVNPQYASGLEALETEWNNRNCHAICPLVACRIPTGAVCSASVCEQTFN